MQNHLEDSASTQSVITARTTDGGMQKIIAYCGFRRGGSGCRPVTSAAEAEKILRGGYGVTNVRLETADGTIVGERYKHDGMDGGKWFWWFDQDYFK